MVARVNQARLDPKDIAAAKEFLHGVVVPGAQTQAGFRNVMMLAREDGHVLVIEVYDSAEQARETETTGWYQRTTEVFEDHLQGQVRRNFYDVTLGVPIDDE
jgi:quinol monooxygenase YgiN